MPKYDRLLKIWYTDAGTPILPAGPLPQVDPDEILAEIVRLSKELNLNIKIDDDRPIGKQVR